MLSPSPLTPTPPVPTARAERLLAGVAVGLMGSVLAAAYWSPSALLLGPLLFAGGWWMWWQHRTQERAGLLFLFGITAVIISEQGLNPIEAVYGVYLLGYAAWWYGSRTVLYRRPLTATLADRAALLLLVGGLVLGPALGVIHGADLSLIRGDGTGFAMLLFYFPIREWAARHEKGPEIILGLLCWLGVYIAVRNFLNFRAILLAATQAWEIADARPGYNALQLMTGAIASAALILGVRRWWLRGALLGVFGLCVSALVLIKYRGFWVALLFGLGVLVLALPAPARRRFLLATAVGGLAVAAGALALFGDMVGLLVEGVVDRFSTLGTAFTKDISLINRFIEADAALERVKTNPVLGHGFGTEFSYFNITYGTTNVREHIHIGYVNILFKLGLWGTLLTAGLWVHAAWSGFVVARRVAHPIHSLAGLAVLATLAGMVFSVLTESPWFQPNQMFGFAALCGLASGLRARYGLVR